MGAVNWYHFYKTVGLVVSQFMLIDFQISENGRFGRFEMLDVNSIVISCK